MDETTIAKCLHVAEDRRQSQCVEVLEAELAEAKNGRYCEVTVMAIRPDGDIVWSYTPCSDIPHAVGNLEMFKHKLMLRAFGD